MKTKKKITDAPERLPSATGYVVAPGGQLRVGNEYLCKHSRKGEFRMRITALNGEWITGVITDGVARAMMSYNVAGEGDEVTIRDSHSYFIPFDGKTT